jgi:glutathione S-transferase
MRWSGSRMPACDIWRRASGVAAFGTMIQPSALSSMAGLVADRAAARLPQRRLLGYYRTPEAQRNWPAIKRNLARCAEYFGLLNGMLATRPFLLGDRLSLADIPIATSLYRYFELDIERPKLPNVGAWYRRLQERPAYREHVMLPFGELRGRLDY